MKRLEVHPRPRMDGCPRCKVAKGLTVMQIEACKGFVEGLVTLWWHQVSEANGCAILPGTAAYLECSVADRCTAERLVA